jgi:molybdenum cofactor guanylyltransferase
VSAISISAIVLAGGKGSRVGFRNKGLLLWNDWALIDWVLDRVGDQVDDIVISANADIAEYSMRGYPVVEDANVDAGPLAGIDSCLVKTQGDYVLTVPCDTPQLPYDLVARLQHGLLDTSVDVAVADDGTYKQYLVALYRREALKQLRPALQQGVRAVRDFQAQLATCPVDFSDCADAFANLNELPPT